MPDYLIDKTDPANGSFVIKPYTTNGPASPGSPTPLDPQAVSADTSIVLLGQGMSQYGERFQESVVHMLEHFSYQSRPVYPIQGQIWFKNIDFDDSFANPTDPLLQGLYVFDGANWVNVPVSGMVGGDFDMDGFKIVNLANPQDTDDQQSVTVNFANDTYLRIDGTNIANPPDTDGQQVVTVNFANDKYLRLDATNDPMSADLVLTANGVFPQANSNIAATITYVNSMTLDGLDGVIITAPTTPSFLRYDGANWIDGDIAINDLSDVTIAGPVNGEVLTYSAGTWINASPAVGADRYVQAGAMNGNTLELTVDTSPSTGAVVVSVPGVAATNHTHTTSNIYHDENPQSFDHSFIRDARVSTVASPNDVYPQLDPFNNAINVIDQAIYMIDNPYKRRVLQSDTTVGPYPTPDYLTYANKLNVYVNGVKQYASSRGAASLLFDTPTANNATNTGLSVADYAIVGTVTPGPGGSFQVAGDQTAFFAAGTDFSVLGSSGNDDVYTVSGSVFGAVTTITVTGTVTTATADGIITVVDVLDYEFDLAVNVVDFPPGTTSTTVTPIRPPPLKISLAITNVDIATETFTVVGDYTTVFASPRIFVVTSSTGNDGNWTVSSSTLVAGNTVITVTGDITDPTIDGTINVAYVSFAGLTEEIQIALDAAVIPVTVNFRDSTLLFVPDSQGATSTVELVETTSGGTDLLGTLDTTFTASEILYDTYGSEAPITGIVTGTDEFQIAGDYTTTFTAGVRFTVQGTGAFVAGFPLTPGANDGVFEVVSSSFGAGTTSIVVTADLTVNTGATGTIYFSRTLAYSESGTPFDDTTPGTSITFTVAPVALALIEINIVAL
jgi:hypothetical protein